MTCVPHTSGKLTYHCPLVRWYVNLPLMQIVLGILANAGGVGKTTLAVHLAYEVSKLGHPVAILDLDPQRSLDVFCGLEPVDSQDSLVTVFSKDFKGQWPLVETWQGSRVQVCQGHPYMSSMSDQLVTRRRGEYALADRLRKYPLTHDLVIIDCPATLGMLATNALAASTHLLVPVQLEMKSAFGAAGLIEWCIEVSDELELNPRPPILGIVPCMYDSKTAIHRQILQQLPEITSQLSVTLYPRVRDSKEFKNASAVGLPLQKYRPNHPAVEDFKVLSKDIDRLIQDAKG